MTRIPPMPFRVRAYAAARPAGPAPTMSTRGSASWAMSVRRRSIVQQGLHARPAIETLAAPEHDARAPLQSTERRGRERRGECVADLAHADPLAVTDHLGIARIALDARCVLPGPLRCFRQVGHGNG